MHPAPPIQSVNLHAMTRATRKLLELGRISGREEQISTHVVEQPAVRIRGTHILLYIRQLAADHATGPRLQATSEYENMHALYLDFVHEQDAMHNGCHVGQ